MRFSAAPIHACFAMIMIAATGSLSGCTSAVNSEAPAVSTEPAQETTLTAQSPGPSSASDEEPVTAPSTKQTATFAAGCFWCVEAVFEQLKSVENVRSGYSGGKPGDATYELVSGGNTGHAEVIQFDFDPAVISYEELLEIFWTSHDPTTLNRQGYDVGPQYRSAIFYHSDEQRKLAEDYKKRLNKENAFGSPVVTEIVPFESFYSAEGYHQDYFAANGNAPYCQRIIRPKVEKVRKVFADKLR